MLLFILEVAIGTGIGTELGSKLEGFDSIDVGSSRLSILKGQAKGNNNVGPES